MNVFGLIGYPLRNTFSVDYFTAKFSALGLHDHVYRNFPLQTIDELPALLRSQPGLQGLNVTVPHKVSVIPYLHRLDETAAAAGAVNCIRIARQDEQLFLTGYNTDIAGFERSFTPWLRQHGRASTALRALILGTGGAAKAVAYVLRSMQIPYLFVSRKDSGEQSVVSYEQLTQDIMQQHLLVINCTPAGMHPHVHEAPPLPYRWITPQHLAYDLIYLPAETLFLQRFREQGAAVKNGLDMLHLQAEKAWTIFSAPPALFG